MSEAQAILDKLAQRGVSVRRLIADSRKIQAGDVFVAYPGASVDGRNFIADALARGAVAVVAEAGADFAKVGVPQGLASVAGGTSVASPAPAAAPVVEVEGLTRICGELAALVYGQPSEQLWLAGITGTNGKTSCSQWIAQALKAMGEKAAVIGTLGSGIIGQLVESANTTPDALTLQSALAGFVAMGVRSCAMEVSSIGIAQHRINGVHFDVAVFTNLTQDHLDFHGSMEAYAAAKQRLFSWPGLQAAVINLDDPFGHQLLARMNPLISCLAYTTDPAMVCARPNTRVLCPVGLTLTGAGVRFALEGVNYEAPVVGRFNVSNILAVIGALLVKGHAAQDIAGAVRGLEPPAGRMQTLGGDGQPLIVVDYAHTPDALEKVLAVLGETAAARNGALACVFGCGGDRDASKRPRMGAAAERLAARVVVTSDNPRSEDPRHIIDGILAGMRVQPVVEPDRRQAIAKAVAEAVAADVVLIAGKGHEPYQEIAGVRYPFSDIDIAKSALATWNGANGVSRS